MCCSNKNRTRRQAASCCSSSSPARNALLQASTRLLARLEKSNQTAGISAESKAGLPVQQGSVSGGPESIGALPSYAAATSNSGVERDVLSADAGISGLAAAPASDAVYRVCINNVHDRLDDRQREALIRLPKTNSFEAFAAAVYAGVHRHVNMLRAKSGDLAKVNADALAVRNIRVQWEGKEEPHGMDNVVDKWNYSEVLDLIAQRGWVDILEVTLG